MEAKGEFVLSIATASPGVLVNAPAIRPTTLGVSMSNAYFSPTAVSPADRIMSTVRIISVFPLLLKESKNPGPACIPIAKINNTRPKFPNSLGIITPKCPNNNAMKITADTSSDSPLILILPNIKPNATMRKSEK